MGEHPATIGSVFAVAEFRALWLAEAQSVAGDQLARVALTVLVFDRTGSAGLTALTYALTLLPDLVGGPLLSGLADRFPRKPVMVTADVVRAVLVAAMALPGLPIVVLAVLLVMVQLAAAPFRAAQQATLPAVLTGDRYVVGQSVRQTTRQLALVLGFAGGGVVVTAMGAREALAVDAATFAVSALLIGVAVRSRPAADRTDDAGADGGAVRRHLARLTGGARTIWRHPRLRALVGLSWLAGFVVVPEGLAAPYAAEIGAGSTAVGLLLAAHAVGGAVGALAIGRWCPPSLRPRLVGPLAVAAMLPLLVFASRPGLAVAVVLLAVSGIFAAYQVVVAAEFMTVVPDGRRGQAYGLAGSGLLASQGLGIAAGGAVADLLGSAAAAITALAAAGAVTAVRAAVTWRRHAGPPGAPGGP